MYLDAKGDVIPGLSLTGHLASGVPGSVDGMVEVHKKFGKVEAPDMEKIAAQKLRLSQSNFHMG